MAYALDLSEIGDRPLQRFLWRQLLLGTITFSGQVVAVELSAELFPVTLEWEELRASDLQGRARAIQSLAAAGVDQERSLEMAGLMSEG